MPDEGGCPKCVIDTGHLRNVANFLGCAMKVWTKTIRVLHSIQVSPEDATAIMGILDEFCTKAEEIVKWVMDLTDRLSAISKRYSPQPTKKP